MRVSGGEGPRAPAHRGLGAPCRGSQRRADARGVCHVLVDAPPRAENVARQLLHAHDAAVFGADGVGDEALAVEPPVVDGDAAVPDLADDGVEQLRLRCGKALAPLQQGEPERGRPPSRDDRRAQEGMPHRDHAARGVEAHLHALHARAAELLGDVARVHRDDGVPADKLRPLAPEMVSHRRGEVVPRKPSRHLLLTSLPRRPVPVQGGGDVRHERASGAHDGGEDRRSGLPRHLAERGEHLAEERFRRALHGVFCYIVRHGETPFWLFAPHIIAEIGKVSPPFPPSRKFISP